MSHFAPACVSLGENGEHFALTSGRRASGDVLTEAEGVVR